MKLLFYKDLKYLNLFDCKTLKCWLSFVNQIAYEIDALAMHVRKQTWAIIGNFWKQNLNKIITLIYCPHVHILGMELEQVQCLNDYA